MQGTRAIPNCRRRCSKRVSPNVADCSTLTSPGAARQCQGWFRWRRHANAAQGLAASTPRSWRSCLHHGARHRCTCRPRCTRAVTEHQAIATWRGEQGRRSSAFRTHHHVVQWFPWRVDDCAHSTRGLRWKRRRKPAVPKRASVAGWCHPQGGWIARSGYHTCWWHQRQRCRYQQLH